MTKSFPAGDIPFQGLKPLDVPSVHRELQERIKDYILSNRLQPDDPLPTEAQLAEQLHVSRTVVREALRALESLGVIYSRRGEGRYVSSFSLDPVLQNLNYSLLFDTDDVRQMIEVRERLEVSFIGDAITHIDQDTLEELKTLVEQMRQSAIANGDVLDKDLAFHCAIYRVIDNRVLSKLLGVFCDIDRNLRGKSLLITWDPIAEVENHERILRAIEAKDGVLAQRRIAEHFSGIKDRIQSAPIVKP